MHFDPRQSREAHPESGSCKSAAASSPTQPQDSPARGHCDLRGSQPASCERGEGAGQQQDTVVRLFHVSPDQLRAARDYERMCREMDAVGGPTIVASHREPIDLYDRFESNDVRVRQLKLEVHPPIPWRQLAIMVLVTAFIGVLLATGGRL